MSLYTVVVNVYHDVDSQFAAKGSMLVFIYATDFVVIYRKLTVC